jgi:hypothetical protein
MVQTVMEGGSDPALFILYSAIPAAFAAESVCRAAVGIASKSHFRINRFIM